VAGLRRTDNPHRDLVYDFAIFKPAPARFVKVRQTRHRIDPESFYEDLFPGEIMDSVAYRSRRSSSASSGSALAMSGSGGDVQELY
jgi:hypothetical protein